jgi:hypothetical protein
MDPERPNLMTLRPRRSRGSRARCILLTDGPDPDVAARLNRLVAPFATVRADRHRWMPRGLAAPTEARLGRASHLVPAEERAELTAWWLAVPGRANTPNWDVAASATIDGQEGLVLVEAKAHSREFSRSGNAATNERNAARIREAVVEAAQGLRASDGRDWAISWHSHYQLANRFAWAWKVATLGRPVVLVYLGFLAATEMRDRGEPFASPEAWDRAVRSHARDLVPDDAWGRSVDVAGTPLVPLIRSVYVPLPATPA